MWVDAVRRSGLSSRWDAETVAGSEGRCWRRLSWKQYKRILRYLLIIFVEISL